MTVNISRKEWQTCAFSKPFIANKISLQSLAALQDLDPDANRKSDTFYMLHSRFPVAIDFLDFTSLFTSSGDTLKLLILS